MSLFYGRAGRFILCLSRRQTLRFLSKYPNSHISGQKFAYPVPCSSNFLRHQPFVVHRTFATKMEESKSEQIEETVDFQETEEEKRMRQDKLVKNTGRAGIFIVVMIVGGLLTVVVMHGFPAKDKFGNPVRDEFSDENAVAQPLKRTWKHLVLMTKDFAEPSRGKLLPEPLPEPYIQPKYTLVVELSGILVHPEWNYGTGWRFKRRPAVEYFLRQVGYPNFEVVIYTSEGGFTANPIVDSLDPDQRIMFRLYRDCTKYVRDNWYSPAGHHVKDLDKINRDLSKVIVLDWDPKCFQFHPENALRVPKWEGDMNDTALVDLAELLKTILTSGADDVRPILQHYSAFDDPARQFRERTMQFQISQLGHVDDEEHKKSLAKGYSGRLFGFRRHS